ncbi:2og-fe oxygenase superfamily protein [Colletotrichum asianum]|uniref:2og-fe oxygenase superfamily protein n=1 Tax=Colletotrichum asianum TaxID=702518 RepID=A0A8H3ZJQ7_9PEZI|nr:2og-fe oxygenase superfamily protein [Colletotrichum asianum]
MSYSSPVSIESDDSENVSAGESIHGEWKEDLYECLQGIKAVGDIANFTRYPTFANPGLKIGDNPPIPLPLAPRDAEVIKAACRQAPFGRGDETVVDTAVRKTWELDHTQFKLSNPEWRGFLTSVGLGAAKGLGLSNIKLNPHKLLLYETGSFFKKHKDSEKEPGMIGTLVVVLPSEHKGGDVHVSFGSDERSFSTAPFSTFDITALAWFSDVSHEVKELVSGYRLALTYNIIQQTGDPQSAAFWGQQAQELKKLLLQWDNNFPDDDFLVYPLDHKYSQSTVSVQNMKGRDKALCKILQTVGSESGFYLLFGHMTRSEGGALPHYYNYGAEDDDDDGEDTYTTMNKIYSPEGYEVAVSIDPEKEQILDMVKFTSGNADSEDEGGFTGNEAAESTLRYHNYVIVLLKKKRLGLHENGYADPFHFDNSVLMAVSDLEKHSDNKITRAAAKSYLHQFVDTRRISWRTVDLLIRSAIELDDSKLFRKAVASAAQQSGKVHSEVLNKTRNFLEERFSDNPGAVDWEKWIGMSGQSSLGDLQTTVSKLGSQFKSEAMRKSSVQWGQKKLNEKLQSQEAMTTQEHTFFMEGLQVQRDNQEWIKSTLLDTLLGRGTRALVYKVLSSVFENRENPDYYDAKKIYRYLLDEFPGILLLKGPDIVQKPIRVGGTCSGPLGKFVAIFNNILDFGFHEHGLQLLKKLCNDLVQLTEEWNPRNVGGDVAIKLLGPLTTALQKHEIPAPSELKNLIQTVVGEGLHQQVPPRPPKPLGWKYKPKAKCNRFTGAICGACDQLNIFLASKKDKVWRCDTSDSLRNHVEAMLRGSSMMGHFNLTIERVGSTCTLIVEKTGKEYADELDHWKESFVTLEDQVKPLRGDMVAGVLGDEVYRELILLEKLRDGEAGTSIAGKKRAAGGAADGQPESSRRLRT